MTLSEYVGRRLGRDAKPQLANFLARPFGAATLAGFWQYWNPVVLGILVVASQSAGLTMARWPVAARWAAHAFVLAGAWWTAAWLTTTG